MKQEAVTGADIPASARLFFGEVVFDRSHVRIGLGGEGCVEILQELKVSKDSIIMSLKPFGLSLDTCQRYFGTAM